MTKRYVGFYSSRPFWAIEPIDLNVPGAKDEFHDLMQEIVFEFQKAEFELIIARDGKVLIRVVELEEEVPSIDEPDLATIVDWWSSYLDYLNAIYLLLDSCVLDVQNIAYLEVSELTRRDVIRATMENGKITGENIATESYVSQYQMGSFLSQYATPPQFDPRLMMRHVFSEEVFECLSEKAAMAITDHQLVQHLSTITKSLSEYKVGNYPVSLVLAWFVIELTLSGKWQRYLEELNTEFDDGSKRINSRRMQALKDGRDYTMSVITNQLELSDEITFKEFSSIDTVRGYRNKVVHQDPQFTCTSEHAKEAIELALGLTLQDYPLELSLNYSYGVIGP